MSSIDVSRGGLVLAFILIITLSIFIYGFWQLVTPTGYPTSLVQSQCTSSYVGLVLVTMAMMAVGAYAIIDYKRRGSVGDYVLAAFIVMLIIYIVFVYLSYQATPGYC